MDEYWVALFVGCTSFFPWFLVVKYAVLELGLMCDVKATRALPPHPIDEHFPELASWFIILTFFTWSGVRPPSSTTNPNH